MRVRSLRFLSPLLLAAVTALGFVGDIGPQRVRTARAQPAEGGSQVQFAPTDDAFTNRARPATNFGERLSLATGGSPIRKSYVRFEVSGLPGTPVKAHLRLFAKDSSPTGFAVRKPATPDFTEEEITFRNAPVPVAVLASSGPVETGTWVTVDVTAGVEGEGPVAFVLTGQRSEAARYQSSEGVELAPQLLVETAPPPITVVAVGDIACDPTNHDFQNGEGTATNCRQKDTSNLAVKLNPDAVLALGDIQYEDGALSKYSQSYDPTWGRLKPITFPAQGNHDGARPGFFEYFDRVPRIGYYSFDLGAWHLIALNSNCQWQEVECHRGSGQEQWLRTDLESHPARCTLAFFHHPRFSSGPHGDNPDLADFWDDFYQAGVDLVLVGHDHLYERLAPLRPDGAVDSARGITQITVGTGGRFIHPITTQRANSEALIGSFGVLELRLFTDRYEWDFVSVPEERVLDSGTDACH